MIKKIPVMDLRVGMYVEKLDLSWFRHPYFFSRRGAIRCQADIEHLVSVGVQEVHIDTERGLHVEELPAPRVSAVPEEPEVTPEPEPEREVTPEPEPEREVLVPKEVIPLHQEMASAREVYSETIQFAREFLQKARSGQTVDFKESIPLVNGIIESTVRNPSALASLTVLRSRDEYTFAHCINVSMLSVVFGQHRGFSREELTILGAGALFHDIGKAQIPERILNKPDRLTEQEFRVMKTHPVEGYALMFGQSGIPAPILQIILEHHEKYNGKGYPRALSGNNISELSYMVSIADVYDAITSDRVYRQAITPNKALKLLYLQRDTDFFPGYVDLFIKCMGIYPVGSLVHLSMGDYGVVVSCNSELPLFPTVRVILDQDMRPRSPENIDLSDPYLRRTEALTISECLDSKTCNIDIESVLSQPC